MQPVFGVTTGAEKIKPGLWFFWDDLKPKSYKWKAQALLLQAFFLFGVATAGVSCSAELQRACEMLLELSAFPNGSPCTGPTDTNTI
jgi:hypothetical protein